MAPQQIIGSPWFRAIEQRGNRILCGYGSSSFAVFEVREDGPKCIVNGKLADVMEKYLK